MVFFVKISTTQGGGEGEYYLTYNYKGGGERKYLLTHNYNANTEINKDHSNFSKHKDSM